MATTRCQYLPTGYNYPQVYLPPCIPTPPPKGPGTKDTNSPPPKGHGTRDNYPTPLEGTWYQRYLTPPNRHTPVKTLHSPNFVGGSNKGNGECPNQMGTGCFYHPPMKFQEGNVFRSMCHSVHRGVLISVLKGDQDPTDTPPSEGD